MRTPHCVSLYSLLSRRSGGQTQSTASHCTMYWGHWDGLQEYHSLVFYNKFKGSFIIDYDNLGVLHQTDRPSQDLVNSFRSSSIGCIILLYNNWCSRYFSFQTISYSVKENLKVVFQELYNMFKKETQSLQCSNVPISTTNCQLIFCLFLK